MAKTETAQKKRGRPKASEADDAAYETIGATLGP